MAQRLSKAYDDVENYENGFTAYYITLINQTDSEIPKITQGTTEKVKELDAQWAVLNTEAKALQTAIKTFNATCFKAGIGVITAN